MPTQSVLVKCDIHCKWNQHEPIYRIYVNQELFTERTWIWHNCYLEEALAIEAPPGQYEIKIEFIDESNTAKIKVKNPRVEQGRAVIDSHLKLEIYP